MRLPFAFEIVSGVSAGQSVEGFWFAPIIFLSDRLSECMQHEGSTNAEVLKLRKLAFRVTGALCACSIAIPAGVTHRLVRNYLLHYGYAKTLRAFDSAAGGSPDVDSQPCSSRQATSNIHEFAPSQILIGPMSCT